MNGVLDWIHDHDDRWSFILAYVGGAVVLSIFLNLFWVALLMFGHFLLELARHYLLGVRAPLAHALWHTKLDFGLVALALVIAVYAEVILGALGLGQAARGAQAMARFGVIERSLRAVLLTVDEAGLLVRALMKGRAKAGGAPEIRPECTAADDATAHAVPVDAGHADAAPWRRPTTGDWASIGFGACCVALIAIAPAFTAHGPGAVAQIIVDEMRP